MDGAPDAKTIHSNQKETVQVVLWNKTIVMYKSSSKKTECFGALRMHKHLSIHNVVVVQEIFEHILLTVVANAFSLCKNQGML